jgi:hypothetical protein
MNQLFRHFIGCHPILLCTHQLTGEYCLKSVNSFTSGSLTNFGTSCICHIRISTIDIGVSNSIFGEFCKIVELLAKICRFTPDYSALLRGKNYAPAVPIAHGKTPFPARSHLTAQILLVSNSAARLSDPTKDERIAQW